MATSEKPFEKVHRKLTAARIEFLGQLARFSREELAQPAGENRWSPLQIAYHLYIADGLALEQMQRVQTEENPLIVNVAEVAPERTNTAEPPQLLEGVLAGMAARREELLEYLSQLPDEAWERPFHHESWGERKFYQLVNVLPLHDQQHAQQLAMLKSVQETPKL